MKNKLLNLVCLVLISTMVFASPSMEKKTVNFGEPIPMENLQKADVNKDLNITATCIGDGVENKRDISCTYSKDFTKDWVITEPVTPPIEETIEVKKFNLFNWFRDLFRRN